MFIDIMFKVHKTVCGFGKANLVSKNVPCYSTAALGCVLQEYSRVWAQGGGGDSGLSDG